LSSRALPTLTSRQVAEVDAPAQERFGIAVDWLMEAAGWQVARFCLVRTAVISWRRQCRRRARRARHLHRWGRWGRSVASTPAAPGARAREGSAREGGVEILDEPGSMMRP
jgi:hypothetical protein